MSTENVTSYEKYSADDGRRVHDEHGRELPDPTPMAPPVGYRPQPSLAEQIRLMVRSERLAAEVAAAGAETFEEADDFDIGDDFDPASPYEADFDPTPVAELKRRKAEAEKPIEPPPPKPDTEVLPPDQGGSVDEAAKPPNPKPKPVKPAS